MNPINTTRVSIYFAMFATITAGLLGLGQGSWNLALLVCFCGVFSVLYTDKFGWLVLPQWMVFLGMIAGASVAIFGYMSNVAANQILAVGNLLVYVQLPLMFQKKSKRVYEHWGVFLLLELVVAALVNDNVLYGFMMLPVLALGCATTMSLAVYASQLRHSESISESTGLWARLMHWLGREDTESKLSSGISLSVPRTNALTERMTKLRFVPSRWLRCILPIAFGVLLFSVVYFYSLPRLNSESYNGALWGSVRIGFSDQISLRHIGEMLQSDAPAFRMSMRDNRKQTEYRPSFPPYIRITVSKRYFDGPSRGLWQSGDRDISTDPRLMQKLPAISDLKPEFVDQADSVTVTVIEKSSFGPYVPVIAPLARSNTQNDFRVLCKDWCLSDARLTSRTSDQKRRYTFSTYAFKNGVESTLLPEFQDCLQDDKSFPFAFETRPSNSYELVEFPSSLEPIIPIRDRILAPTASYRSDRLSQAIIISEYLASGREYTYSLSLTRPVDPNVDPIVDFLNNKRKGHCQYFASSLVMMMRSLEIPSRIVIGYRPNEYNELGKYFSVQQNHAHVWVEAYFTREELMNRYTELPNWVKHGAWVRFDPTPAGDGSNAGASFRTSTGQALDAMQDLWNELVMNMDKSKQSNLLSLFGESSTNSYSGVWAWFRSAIETLQSSKIAGGLLSPDRWFSWKVALGITCAGAAGVLLYRLLAWMFPNWMPFRRWRKLSQKSRASKIDFYDRLVLVLRRHGLQRFNHQTQQEFLLQAKHELAKHSLELDAEGIGRLFYARRFGGVTKLSDAERKMVDESIQALESAKRGVRRGGANQKT
jgi:protein-glutamine gamma-glutamyltransferase